VGADVAQKLRLDEGGDDAGLRYIIQSQRPQQMLPVHGRGARCGLGPQVVVRLGGRADRCHRAKALVGCNDGDLRQAVPWARVMHGPPRLSGDGAAYVDDDLGFARLAVDREGVPPHNGERDPGHHFGPGKCVVGAAAGHDGDVIQASDVKDRARSVAPQPCRPRPNDVAGPSASSHKHVEHVSHERAAREHSPLACAVAVVGCVREPRVPVRLQYLRA